MAQLKELSLPRCHLQGPLPDWLFHHLPDLRVLDLSNNQLTGPLPPSLGRCCPRLEVVKLSFNAFEGTCARVCESVCACVIRLWGSVGRSVARLIHPPTQPPPPTHTQPHNHTTGEIPASWAALPALKTLSLSYNRLAGAVPAFSSPKLEALLLGGNSFTGHVPELGACHALQKLLLNGNNLSGRLVRALVLVLGVLCVGGGVWGVWGVHDDVVELNRSLTHTRATHTHNHTNTNTARDAGQAERPGGASALLQPVRACVRMTRWLASYCIVLGRPPGDTNSAQRNMLTDPLSSTTHTPNTPTNQQFRLEGVIPDELERCEKLQTLDLQGNRFETGACLAWFCFSRLWLWMYMCICMCVACKSRVWSPMNVHPYVD